jgi:hypothetical protein
MKITIIDVTESDLGVRKIPMNYRSVTGRVQTLDGQTVPFESTLERDLVLLMDFDSQVARITHQPMKIRYRLDSGEERTYTPDYLATFRGSPVRKPARSMLFEVKYLDELRDRWQELEVGFRAARMVCAQRRWGFQIADENYIRDDYLKNVTFLRDYRSYPSDGRSSLMLLQTLQELQVSTPSELLAATFMDLTNRMQAVGAMWRMVANGSIGSNLRQKLTMKSEIWYEEPALYGK